MSLELTAEQYLSKEIKDRLINLRREALQLSINRNKNLGSPQSYDIKQVLIEADKYYDWLIKNV